MKKTLLYLSIIVIAIISNACGKKKEDPKPATSLTPSNPYNATSDYYWDATIDGTQKTFVRLKNGYLDGASMSNTSTSTTYSNQYGSAYGKYTIGQDGMELANDNSGIIFNLPSDPSQSQYNDFFTVATKTYATSEETLNSVYIYWTDPNGNYWTTYNGSQTGSTFNITKVSDVYDAGNYYKAVEGTFTCKLYNGSNVKTVTNGKFRGFMALYNANI